MSNLGSVRFPKVRVTERWSSQSVESDSEVVVESVSSSGAGWYAWPSGEVFRDYKYLSAEIYFVRENIFNPRGNMFLLRKYILCAEIISTSPEICLLLPENIFMFCKKCWASPEFYLLPRKLFVVPFVSHARIFYFHARIFLFRAILGQAVMP